MQMINDRKTYVMQRIQRAARVATRYAIFECKTKQETSRLLRQFAAAYETEISASSKSKRRKSGIATATAYAYKRPKNSRNSDSPFWVILLVSKGMGLVEREKLLSLRDRKTRIELDGYELVHDGVSWSWQMTRATENYWKARIRRICAAKPENRNPKNAQRVVDSIANAPKFRIVRKQIGHLFAHYRKEWARLRPKSDPEPIFPTFLPYVRQMPKNPPRQP